MRHLVNALSWPVLPVLYTGRLFLTFGGPVALAGKAIVHWIGCINAIKIIIKEIVTFGIVGCMPGSPHTTS